MSGNRRVRSGSFSPDRDRPSVCLTQQLTEHRPLMKTDADRRNDRRGRETVMAGRKQNVRFQNGK